MEIPDIWAPLLLCCVRDAIVLNEQRLQSETLRNRFEYEEHEVQLHVFLDHLKEAYAKIEAQVGIPLAAILPAQTQAAEVIAFESKQD